MSEPATSASTLRRVLEALPRSIVVTDPDGTIVIWNEVATHLFGWPEAEVVGRPIGDVLLPAGADETPPVALDGLEPGASWFVERTVIRRDGSTVRVRATTRVLFDADGKVEFVVAASEDISQIHALEEAARASSRLERVQRQRLELVSAVNDALEASDDLPDLLRRVIDVVVPRLGDWSTLHVFPDAESTTPLVDVAHTDPSMVAYAHELQAEFPYHPDALTPAAVVVRTGEPVFLADITPELLDAWNASPESRRIADELALRSFIAVPLAKHGRVLGVLQLAMADGQRRYTDEDLALAEAVAARIAATLDNRRLRDAQVRTGEVDARLAALGWQLAAAADLPQVLSVIASDAGAVMDADVVEVGLVFDAEHVHAVRAGGSTSADAIDRFDVHDLRGPSAMSRAVLTRERQFLEDGDEADPLVPEARALIASPLFDADHHSIGVLVFSWHHPRRFDEFDRTAIDTLSRLCGAALRRAETSGYTNRLGDLATAMAATRSTGEVARLLRDHGTEALGASVANLRLLDGRVGTLRNAIESPLPPAVADRYAEVRLDDGLPLTDAVRDDTSVWVPNLVDYAERYPKAVEVAVASDIGATAAVPLHDSEGTVIGAVTFGWGAAMHFDAPLRSRLRTLCDLAAKTLERVSLYEAEHALITTMQRQLLTPLPTVDGLELAALYEPAAAAVGMGGDWYDAIPMADGSLVVVVGDIVGHGVEAVAAMARLQHLITGLIRTGAPLSEVFERANETAQASEPSFATTVLLHVDAASQRLGVLRAGHPWPLLRTPDGSTATVAGAQQPMIGARMKPTSIEYVDLPPGSLVLAYTDGLIERRTEPIGTSVDRLAGHLEAAGGSGTAEEILDRVVQRVAAERDEHATNDDTAAVLIRSVA